MNKLIVLALLLVLLPTVLAEDVGYIVKNPLYPSQAIINSINNLNLTYKLIDDSQISTTNFSNFGAIIVSEKITNAPVNTYPSIIVSPDYYADWSSTIGSSAGSSPINLYKLNNSITNYTLGYFTAYTQAKDPAGFALPVYYLAGQKYTTTSMTITNNYEPGNFVIATKTNPRRIFFGITQTNYWTQDTVKLFENSIIWVVKGEDKDKDGYSGFTDCDDNNPNIWQSLQAYVDSDEDLFGFGNLISVCTNGTLPTGYVDNILDCNDNNLLINPNATEIPYNNIDDSCSGYDLADIDNDGYCKLGYIIQNQSQCELETSSIGTDCNDNNTEISPGSSDVLKNCVNDAPILISDIQDINWDENSNYTLNLSQYFQDPENETLEYGIYNTSENKNITLSWNSSTVTFNSPENWNGNDWIIFYASDSRDYTITNTIQLTVNPINQAPILQSIADITVSEEQEVLITINAIDSDSNLTYSVNDSRFVQDENNFTWLTQFGDRGEYYVNISVADEEFSDSQIIKIIVNKLNRAPIIQEINAQTTQEDTQLSFTINASDPDNDELVYSASGTNTQCIVNNQIITVIPYLNFNGDASCTIIVSDEVSNTTQTVPISIAPVNDVPIFSENINNLSLDENSSILNAINLSNYFSDIDSNLTFTVSGNNHINVEIEGDLVSIYPELSWYGTESVIFIASDDEYSTDSNDLSINVIHANTAPVFGQMNCTTEILGENEYSCDLNATDFENNTIQYTALNSSNLNCIIQDNQIFYTASNQAGNASCIIRASDSLLYAEFLLNVNVTPINHIPLIVNFGPRTPAKVLNNTNKTFYVNTYDSDSAVNISWILNTQKVGFGYNYIFNQDKGNHILQAIVSDGELNVSQTWNILSTSIDGFTCSEAGGHICGLDQMCTSSLLGVSNSNSCCSISCTDRPPEFGSINCSNISSNIQAEITLPIENKVFYIGDYINLKYKIENNENKTINFNTAYYLYDTTKGKIISKDSDNIKVAESEDETSTFNFSVPDSIDEDNNYFIFIKTNSNQYCAQDYIKVDLQLPDYSLAIQDMEIDKKEYSCGDYISLDITTQNLGKYDEDAELSISNQKLGISQTKSISLDSNGNKEDTLDSEFEIKIPDNATQGEYPLKIILLYNDGDKEESTINLNLEECKVTVTTLMASPEQTVSLNTVSNSKVQNTKTSSLFYLFLLIGVLVLILVLVLLIFYYYSDQSLLLENPGSKAKRGHL